MMEYLSVLESRRELIRANWFNPQILPNYYRDYFKVEYDLQNQSWAIEAGPYIGIVPLNSDYGVQILPKSGLKNLTYMLYKSGLLSRSLETPFEQTVPYHIPEDDLESFFEGLVHSFLECVDQIKSLGLIRQTVLENQEAYSVRGKIDFLRWLRQIPHRGGVPIPQLVFEAYLDNLPNRVLRRCLEYLANSPLRYTTVEAILGRLDYFGQVSSSFLSATEIDELENQIESGQFPASRYYYLPALNLALLILRGAGLALGDDHDVAFKPIIINTAYVFENYVRVLCQEAVKPFDARAEDGKQFSLPFYKEAVWAISVKPDILIRYGGSNLFVVDVKYKFAPTEQDHYQLWAYLNTYGVNRGGFVSVVDIDRPKYKNPALFKRDDKVVFDYSFNCRAIKISEAGLKELITNQLQLTLT